MRDSTDYKGRLIDVGLLKTVTTAHLAAPVRVDMSVTDNQQKATGIQKLVQRYAVLLLTEIGTVKFAEDQGATLAMNLRRGHVGSTGFLTHMLHIASGNALDIINAEDEAVFGTQPPDEIIQDVVFDNVLVDGKGYATARGVITTAEGEAAEFVIPVS